MKDVVGTLATFFALCILAEMYMWFLWTIVYHKCPYDTGHKLRGDSGKLFNVNTETGRMLRGEWYGR